MESFVPRANLEQQFQIFIDLSVLHVQHLYHITGDDLCCNDVMEKMKANFAAAATAVTMEAPFPYPIRPLPPTGQVCNGV